MARTGLGAGLAGHNVPCERAKTNCRPNIVAPLIGNGFATRLCRGPRMDERPKATVSMSNTPLIPQATVIYIGGYGHSGSTLLESLLTASPDVIGCGEVVGALYNLLPARKCSCGRTAEDCPIWGTVAGSAFMEIRADADRWTHVSLDAALQGRGANLYKAMIDSSKTAWRHVRAPFQLRRRFGANFVLMHMVRNPKGAAWSVMQRSVRMRNSRSQALLCISAAAGWLIANIACETFRLRYPLQYQRLRYEDLVEAPRDAIKQLLEQVLPGGDLALQEVGAFDNRHQLHGNRMRLETLSFADVRMDDGWKDAMPHHYQRLTGLLTKPLARLYDYA